MIKRADARSAVGIRAKSSVAEIGSPDTPAASGCSGPA